MHYYVCCFHCSSKKDIWKQHEANIPWTSIDLMIPAGEHLQGPTNKYTSAGPSTKHLEIPGSWAWELPTICQDDDKFWCNHENKYYLHLTENRESFSIKHGQHHLKRTTSYLTESHGWGPYICLTNFSWEKTCQSETGQTALVRAIILPSWPWTSPSSVKWTPWNNLQAKAYTL